MKEIIKERTKIEKYTVYQATDGTEFNDSAECLQYEKSALGVLRGRLKTLVVNNEYNAWDLMGGYEDNNVLAIKVSSEEDIDIVLQNYYLDNPWLLNDSNSYRKDKVIHLIRQAYIEQDIIFFGLNCDDDLYIIDTRNNIINRLNSLD